MTVASISIQKYNIIEIISFSLVCLCFWFVASLYCFQVVLDHGALRHFPALLNHHKEKVKKVSFQKLSSYTCTLLPWSRKSQEILLFLLVTTLLKARNVCICCFKKRKSYVQTDGITRNIVGPTMLEVVASVLVVVGKRIQQLPAMLGPAVHRGTDTTQKTLETMCNAGSWPQQCWKSCANESNIVVLRLVITEQKKFWKLLVQ